MARGFCLDIEMWDWTKTENKGKNDDDCREAAVAEREQAVADAEAALLRQLRAFKAREAAVVAR